MTMPAPTPTARPAAPPAAEPVARTFYEPLLHLLDHNPAIYLSFGVYWWTLKRLLRTADYHREYLGDSDDPVCRKRMQRYAGTDPRDILRLAAGHHRAKIEHGEMYDGGSYFPDDSGDTYALNDPDFGPAERGMPAA